LTGAPGNPFVSRLRWELRTLAGTQPWLTDALVRKSGSRISEETEVVIEGFPRTGNTFAVVAFTQAQRRPVSIAHHVHLPSMVKRAVDRGVPCVVLIREPRETILSLVVRLPVLSVRQAVRSYLRFYEPLLPLRHRVVVASFEDVTRDFGGVIDRLNARYRTSFDRFEHTQENERSVLDEVDRWDRGAFGDDAGVLDRSRARPTEARAGLKDTLRDRYLDDRLWSVRLRAERVHEMFVETARS